MQSTHLLISQADIEKHFQSATTEDQKHFIMDLWEKGKDLDLSSTTVAMDIAAATNYESITAFQNYFANGYKKAIENITNQPPAPAGIKTTIP